MPEAPVPAQAAPAAGGDSGVADAIMGLEAGLSKLAKSSADNPNIPEGAKAAIQASLQAFQAFTSELTGGGGEAAAPAPAPGGAVPAMGGPAGVPMSHGRPG